MSSDIFGEQKQRTGEALTFLPFLGGCPKLAEEMSKAAHQDFSFFPKYVARHKGFLLAIKNCFLSTSASVFSPSSPLPSGLSTSASDRRQWVLAPLLLLAFSEVFRLCRVG